MNTRKDIPSPVRIDFESGSFKGKSGKTYYIVDSLPVDYWIQYQMLIPELTYGVEFKDLHMTMKKAYEALTSGNELMKGLRLAGDLLYNQMSSITGFAGENRTPAVLRMAALWCIAEDEDLKKYDPNVAKKKIEDWKETGIDINDFFFLCGNKIQHFKEIYLDFYQKAEEIESQKTPNGQE